MSKMSSSEAYQIFAECEELIKRLKQENALISKSLKEQDKAGYHYHLDTYNRYLVPSINDCIEKASLASEYAGWWNKKIARTYLTSISHEFKYLEWGVNLLGQ